MLRNISEKFAKAIAVTLVATLSIIRLLIDDAIRNLINNSFNFAEWAAEEIIASIVLVLNGFATVMFYLWFYIKWFSIGFERGLRTENVRNARILLREKSQSKQGTQVL